MRFWCNSICPGRAKTLELHQNQNRGDCSSPPLGESGVDGFGEHGGGETDPFFPGSQVDMPGSIYQATRRPLSTQDQPWMTSRESRPSQTASTSPSDHRRSSFLKGKGVNPTQLQPHAHLASWKNFHTGSGKSSGNGCGNACPMLLRRNGAVQQDHSWKIPGSRTSKAGWFYQTSDEGPATILVRERLPNSKREEDPHSTCSVHHCYLSKERWDRSGAQMQRSAIQKAGI
eukprot:scaffold690_cov327-Pavlova_lutheri.AAC.3